MSEEEKNQAAEAAPEKPAATETPVATEKPADAEQPATAEGEAPEGAEGEEKKSGQPTAKDLLTEDLGIGKIRKAKGSKNIHSGIVHILATFNNTKVTFTDTSGNVISWSSAGKMNFRGSRKSTAYAAQVVTQDAGKVALSHGLKEVTVKVKGPGMGRDSAIRALQSLGLIVTAITDTTPVPHNGCRPPKRRRV
ncbi:MAG: 30S ribosomal protein S11 [Verrucomicrobiota bacterium]